MEFKLFSPNIFLLSILVKNFKYKIYKTMIFPVVLCNLLAWIGTQVESVWEQDKRTNIMIPRGMGKEKKLRTTLFI